MSGARASGKALVVAGIVLAAGGIVATNGVLRDNQSGAGRPAGVPSLLEERRLAAATPEQRLALLQERARSNGGDPKAWASLGMAYLDQARRSGDSRLYPKAGESFDRSLKILPESNGPALVGLSALAAARHDFAEALVWAERARALDPQNAIAMGVTGDALVELGRYDEAFAIFQAMVDRRPDLSSYARVAYARELQGDIPGAIAAFEAARGTATNAGDDAFATFHIGELHRNAGRVAEAVGSYERARRLDPELQPAELALARAAYWNGQPLEARAAYAAAVDRLPLPATAGYLGDLYAATGEAAAAAEQYELVDVQRRLAAADGVNGDLEWALFSADHSIALDDGLAAAEAEWSKRKSVHAADALAWQLYRHGRHAEALQTSDRALRLGARKALFHYHRAKIHQALGNADAARRDLEMTLEINAQFSVLHENDLRQSLDVLTRGPYQTAPARG